MSFLPYTRPQLGGLPHLDTFTWQIVTRLTGLPYLADLATRLGGSPHLSCKRDHDKIRNYMDRRVTPPRRITSPTWGPPPPCKQALSESPKQLSHPRSRFYEMVFHFFPQTPLTCESYENTKQRFSLCMVLNHVRNF